MKNLIFTILSILSPNRRTSSRYLQYVIAGLSIIPFANCTKHSNSSGEYVVVFTKAFSQEKFGSDTTGIGQYLYAFIEEKGIPSKNYISYSYAIQPNTSLYFLVLLNEVEVKTLQSDNIVQSVIPNKEFNAIGTDSSPQ